MYIVWWRLTINRWCCRCIKVGDHGGKAERSDWNDQGLFCISVWSYIYNNKWEYISFAFYFIILNYIFSIKVFEIYYIKSTEKKGKSFRNHSLHGKIAASVLLKLFINGNERCIKTRIMHARNYIIHVVQLCKNERKCTSLTILYYIRIHVEIFNINWRDVQTKNVANNVDMSCLRAPWQNGPYKN